MDLSLNSLQTEMQVKSQTLVGITGSMLLKRFLGRKWLIQLGNQGGFLQPVTHILDYSLHCIPYLPTSRTLVEVDPSLPDSPGPGSQS